jgi:hypothetical protein
MPARPNRTTASPSRSLTANEVDLITATAPR